MKIEYQSKLSLWQLIKAHNIMNGLVGNKRKLKKKENIKIETYRYQIISIILLCMIPLPIMAIEDDIEFWTFLFLVEFVLIIFSILIFVSSFLFCYLRSLKNSKQGVLQLSKETFSDSTEKGKTNTRNWDEVEFIYIDSEFIFILCNRYHVFYFQNENELSEKIKQYLDQNKLKIMVIENRKKKKILLLILKYFALFLLMLGIVVFVLIKQEEILNEELNEIKFQQSVINENIESDGIYAKMETIAKEYLKKYYEQKKEYTLTSTLHFFDNFNINDLILRKRKVKEYYEKLDEKKEKSIEIINELQTYLKEENMKKYAEEKELEEWNVNRFSEKMLFVLEDEINYSWEEEKNKIEEKTEYLRKLLQVLLKEDASWIIEDDKIYFEKEEDYHEYLKNYNLYADFPLQGNKEII